MNLNIKKIIFIFAILFGLLISSYGYYTNISKYFDEQEASDGYGGDSQKRILEDFIVDGCGSETMLDTITGLCWDKNLSRSSDTNWAGAISFCSGLSHPSGSSGWRLPQNGELLTLTDMTAGPGITCSSLEGFGFTNCQGPGFYWSSNDYVPDTSKAWGVSLASTHHSYFFMVKTTASEHVVCVRNN